MPGRARAPASDARTGAVQDGLKMFGILQLSDIHFRSPSGGPSLDLDREQHEGLLEILPFVEAELGPIDLVIVSGDIAFSGSAEQYAQAEGFLRDIRSKLGDPEIPVLVIPGNHDVHRSITDQVDQLNIRTRPRLNGMSDAERNNELASLLGDTASGEKLLEPLRAYNEFAAIYRCRISRQQPYWQRSFPIDERWTLNVRGLNSVLLSGSHDNEDLLVGTVQFLGWEATVANEINLTLCHHPYSWLLDRNTVEAKVRRRSHLHITGHIHQHGLTKSSKHVHLQSGALQPPRGGPDAARFEALRINILTTTDDRPKLEITILAMIWDSEADRFVADTPNCDTCHVELLPDTEDGLATAALARELHPIDRMAERFGTLPSSDQTSVVRALGIDLAEYRRLPAHERFEFTLEQARARQQLGALWEQIEKFHGLQAAGPNPFREAP